MLNIKFERRDLIVAVTGRMVSFFGDGVALVALTLRLQSDGAQPYEVALLLAAGAIPFLLLARPVGRLVDAHDSRRLLVSAGIVETACTVPLVVLHSVVLIVVLVAVLGAAASVSAATWSALIPRVVGEDHIAEAVSVQQTLNALAMVAAPAVGGLLAGAFGAGVPLTIDAVTFVAVTLASAVIRTRRTPTVPPAAEKAPRVRGGFEIVRADCVLVPLMVGAALVVVVVGMVDVVLVFLIRQTLHAGGIWFGAAEAAWMAGIVMGSVATGRIGTDRARTQATILGMGVVCAALAPFAVVPDVWMLLPLSVIGGIGNGYAITCLSTLLVTRTPELERGRVLAVANAVFRGAQGISLLAGGAVAVVLPPRDVYAVAGLLGVAAAVVVGVVEVSRSADHLRTDSLDPAPDSTTTPVTGTGGATPARAEPWRTHRLEDVLDVRDLRMRFGDTEVLNGVSFAARPGEVLALLGPNGAGKTTTIEILEGFRMRSAGHVSVLGADPAHGGEAWRARTGIVLQSWRDHTKWQVRELLAHLGRYYAPYSTAGVTRPWDVDDLLETVGLTAQARQRVRHLSGGQRRRLDVAIGIVGRPELVFLDEPTAGFDPEARRDFHDVVHRLADEGQTTILLTTHDLDEAERLADRILILAGGTIIADGTAAQLAGSLSGPSEVGWSRDGQRFVRAADDATAFVRELFRQYGQSVEDLEVRRARLEDTYLALIRQVEHGGPRPWTGAPA